VESPVAGFDEKIGKLQMKLHIKIKVCLMVIILFAALILQAYADIIYLKNNRKMKGIIKTETEEEVALDLGCGTITILKKDIKRIERETEEEKKKIIQTWQNKYIETGRWIPEEAKDLFATLEEVKEKRREVVKAKRRSESLQNTIDSQAGELSGLYAKSEELNTQLNQMTKESDVFAYNKLVAEINSTSAKIGKLIQGTGRAEQRKKDLDRAFSNEMKNYVNKLTPLTESFNKKYALLKEEGVREKNKTFYKWVEEEVNNLHGEFERKEIGFSKDKSGIVVSATLNGKVTGSFIVDTGASLVTISKRIAGQLGIVGGEKGRKIKLVLADGKTITADPVILGSVDVGGSEVKNVMAAVIENPPGPNIDGLLGMSFLSNFFIKIDTNENSLMLEKFNPK